ncbi:peroxisomal membrane protein PEX13-like [Artemia franciscana]|uniref:Peroxisomal membrane protein PEX13 n=1 Tax=Artemia franciscana TaxID=6661 RepID=A0AA88I2F6_ARTSF|nr:hypothetical protein QYM36_005855 [Artemia franciscana]
MQTQNRTLNAEVSPGFQYNLPPGNFEINGGGRVAPPVPPRAYQPSVTSQYGLVSNYGYPSHQYGSYSSPYTSGMYGYDYRPQYGSYGGYGAYGGYGTQQDQENRFIMSAEESSRAAFQSIESIVRAFSSVSMMLDSTLAAVYSTFRAVLGVAENFQRMKNNFTAVLSALAIMKTFKWFLRKMLYYIGIAKENPTREAWTSAMEQVGGRSVLTETDIKKTKSSWPILMYLAIISSAPYVMWKILSSLTHSEPLEGDKSWATGETEHYLAVAEFSFTPASDKEISFSAGQQLTLAPKELQPRVRGWILASADGVKTGLVPANYIRILGKQPPRRKNQDVVITKPQRSCANKLPEGGNKKRVTFSDTVKQDIDEISSCDSVIDSKGEEVC